MICSTNSSTIYIFLVLEQNSFNNMVDSASNMNTVTSYFNNKKDIVFPLPSEDFVNECDDSDEDPTWHPDDENISNKSIHTQRLIRKIASVGTTINLNTGKLLYKFYD